jgi:hypothetical protein
MKKVSITFWNAFLILFALPASRDWSQKILFSLRTAITDTQLVALSETKAVQRETLKVLNSQWRTLLN